MPFTPGDNVFVSLPDLVKPIAGTVVHENKSGTIRVLLENGEKVTVSSNFISDSPENMKSPTKKATPRRKSRGRSPAQRGKSQTRARSKSSTRKKTVERKPAAAVAPTPVETVEIVEASASQTGRRRAAIRADIKMKESPSMSLRYRKWDASTSRAEDAVDSDGDEVNARGRRRPKETTPKKEFGGPIGIIIMFVVLIGILFTAQLMIRNARQSIGALKANQSDMLLPTLKNSFDIRKIEFRTLYKGFPKFDLFAAAIYYGFFAVQMILSLVPIGILEPAVPGTPGPTKFRCNGLVSAFLTLSTICIMKMYFNIGLNQKQLFDMLPTWSFYAVINGILLASVCAFRASRLPLSVTNPRVSSSGRIYSFLMGKEVAPEFGILNFKAAIFKYAINTVLAIHLVLFLTLEKSQKTPTFMLAFGMLNFYLADALLFERYFYSTFEYSVEGSGLMLTLGYTLYPFFALLMPLYLVVNKVQTNLYVSCFITLVYLLGYLIYRSSNIYKAKFRKNPVDPMFSDADTIPTGRGPRLVCHGWWKWSRHPNYTGDILMHLCMATISGFMNPMPMFWPLVTVFFLLHRSQRVQERCQAKYGDAWKLYCEKVKYRLCPRIF